MDDSRPSQGDVLELDDYKNCENDAESEPIDRLSELPDALILHILSLLPMRDVVRTTVLSKRWVDLWTTVPCLIFEDIFDLENFEDYTPDPFVEFVNEAMVLWRGSKIQKFAIMSKLEDWDCLDYWLDVALDHKVEELHIDLEFDHFAIYDLSSYFLPQRLYSSSSMRKLSLIGCRMEIDGTVHWDNLKSLTIAGVVLKEYVMDDVLSGCPQLEVLHLRLWESENHLNIHSSSLKKLKIEKRMTGGGDFFYFKDTTLTIWAPNLEILEMSGAMYCKYLLKNVVSLTNVTLGFSDDWNFSFMSYYEDEVLEYTSVISETLMQVFQSIRRVESFTISNWCIQTLEEVVGDQRILPSDAKFLKLCVSDEDDIPKIVNMLNLFPKLTMLVLEDGRFWTVEDKYRCIDKPYVLTFDEENLVKYQEFPESSLMHLRTVEIICAKKTSWINKLVEILQKCSIIIQKMVVRPTEFKRTESVSFGSTEN